MLKSKSHTSTSWRPTTTWDACLARAALLKQCRRFFEERLITEVDTPLLCQHTVTDPNIHSFAVNTADQPRYLQTSPEYAMKRLLCAYPDQPIYQITKAFRQEESGSQHNPEFTMLEWYRPGWTHQELMAEVSDFLQATLKTAPAIRYTYAHTFQKANLPNPHTSSLKELLLCIEHNDINLSQHIQATIDLSQAQQILFSELIEPTLGHNAPTIIYDYPVTQASLAIIRQDDPPVAERFEVYVQGTELANGFHELRHAREQEQRFDNDNIKRENQEQNTCQLDPYLLSALEHGLPHCAGIALGIDRLLMIIQQAPHCHDVISFPWDRA